MMNVLALGLVISSLAGAGIFSPPPVAKTQQHDHHDHLIREGHRVVVVEYEREIPHEPPQPPSPTAQNFFEDAKEKFQEAASYLPNLGQGLSAPLAHEVDERSGEAYHRSTLDGICDAYGKCKKKVSGLFGKSEHKEEQTTHQPGDAIKDSAGTTMEGGEDVHGNISSVTEIGLGKADVPGAKTIDKAKEATEVAIGKVKEVGEAAIDKAQKAGEVAVEKARDAGHAAVDNAKGATHAVIDKAKDAGKAFVDRAKDGGEVVVGKAKHARQAAVDKAEETVKADEELRRNLTDIIRRAGDVLRDAVAYLLAPEKARAAAVVAHLLSFSVAYGTMVWVTFVSSHVLAGALPRQQFGLVQSKLYPIYFRAVGYSIATAFLAHFYGGNRKLLAERVQGYNLLAALGLVLVNMLVLEPKATKVMFERMKIEKEELRGRDMADLPMEPPAVPIRDATVMPPAAYGTTRTEAGADPELVKSRVVKLSKRLKNLNNYSSFLNVLTLMSLSWHLVHLARLLQISA